MSRKLDDLHPWLRERVFELIARLTEERIYVVIVDTLRTPIEHQENLAKGVSWVQRSKHLPDAEGFSRAIDLCPVMEYQLRGANKLQWNAADPAWQRIGAIGEHLGLRWGGRWQQKDMGHLEIPGDINIT